MAAIWKYLTPEDIRRLRNYEFGVKAMCEGWLSGRHRSTQRGSSTEFHEFRQYVPGDDPARVDWRVFARSDRLFLRTFEQETNLECHIVLDCSASMGFAGAAARWTKLEYTSFFAACLAWLVVSGGDRVSLTLFDRSIRRFLPPGSTRRHLHELLTALEHNHPGEGTSLTETLQRASALVRRRGTLVILSDFFHDSAALFRALNPWLHRGFRIHLLHVLDPAEEILEDRGLARFEDMESGESLTVHPRVLREAWTDALLEHTRALRSLSSSRRVEYLRVNTSQSYFQLFDTLRR
jgi:uncharacterized protein (DUF58 family)